MRKLLENLLAAAITAAQPRHCMPPVLARVLPRRPPGRLIVIGAGKAAAAMARAIEDHYGAPLEGCVVTRYGHTQACRAIEVIEAGHPLPDATGQHAAARMLARVSTLGAEDTVLCLLSGGGSALLPLPLDGITLADKQAITGALLRCGASIAEINCVRRHLSAIKGGRLAAAAHPARVITLAISDVPGDSPCDIASGPTVGDPTTCGDALAILERYAITLPDPVRAVLKSGHGETIKPGDARLARSEFHLVATPQQALLAAAETARAAGYAAYLLSDRLEGEAREVGKVLAGIAHQVARHGQPFAPPCVLLSGGETTVTVRGTGSGGRNVEFLLALGIALAGLPGVHALAADTDGIDGMAPIAGAYLAPDTLARARALGREAQSALAANDGHGFFGALGDSIVTGPTLTNVNDFRALLIERRLPTT